MLLQSYSFSKGGPSPKFTAYHIWKAYETIDKEGPIGRKSLAKVLSIGEGSTRTILDKMVAEGDVKNTRRGAVLTQKGEKKFSNSGIEVRKVSLSELTLDEFDCAVHIKGMAHLVDSGCRRRDEAIRAGASGATTLVYKGGRLAFPGEDDFPNSDEISYLEEVFNIQENDVVIIGTGDSYLSAERGAVTTALLMGNENDQSWEETCNILSGDTEAEELKCLALAIHELMGRLPVTMRSKNHLGVRCEGGEVIDSSYTGPLLEEVLEKSKIVRKVAPRGSYAGVPIVAVPILRENESIAVIGVVDITKGAVFEIMQRMRGREE